VRRGRTWTDDDLRDHVANARSWRDLRNRLGLVGGGDTTRRLRKRCEDLGLDVRHLPKPGQPWRKWSDDQLVEAVQEATSLHGVFKHLGLVAGGSAWLVAP
jgi:hypothetical protein